MQNRHRVNLAAAIAVIAAFLGAGCATMQSDPLDVTVAGFEPLEGEGMELRMLVKLRVQNPNDKEIVFNGASVKMDLLNKSFASGVTDMSGTVPRFGEAIVEVPVTASLFKMVGQALGMLNGKPLEKVPYEMTGKLQTGSMSSVHFTTRGEFEMPKGFGPAAPAPAP